MQAFVVTVSDHSALPPFFVEPEPVTAGHTGKSFGQRGWILRKNKVQVSERSPDQCIADNTTDQVNLSVFTQPEKLFEVRGVVQDVQQFVHGDLHGTPFDENGFFWTLILGEKTGAPDDWSPCGVYTVQDRS
jgi:hypothetical protein